MYPPHAFFALALRVCARPPFGRHVSSASSSSPEQPAMKVSWAPFISSRYLVLDTYMEMPESLPWSSYGNPAII